MPLLLVGIPKPAIAQTYADADCGQPIGTLDGVPSRSNASDTTTWLDCGDKPAGPSQAYPTTSIDGDPFQCVELVRRYYRVVIGMNTAAWPHMNAAKFYTRYAELGLKLFPNGDPNPPQVGDIVVFGAVPGNSAGHIAIVSGVTATSVTILEQNWSRYNGYATLQRSASSTGWMLYRPSSAYPVLGWLRKASSPTVYRLTAQGIITTMSENASFPLPVHPAIGDSFVIYWDIDNSVQSAPTSTGVWWSGAVRQFGFRTGSGAVEYAATPTRSWIYTNTQANSTGYYYIQGETANVTPNYYFGSYMTLSSGSPATSIASSDPTPLSKWSGAGAGLSVCSAVTGQCLLSGIGGTVLSITYQALY